MNLFEIFYKDRHEFLNLELTLSRVDNALSDFGFNAEKLGKVIHIAGTNGKGSTAYFLQQLLMLQGIRVALFTSPHIIEINERINFSGVNISTTDFDEIFKQIENVITKYKLSYFEAVFVIAIVYFTKKSPDVTILETGLGGRFDATNTNAINDKIAVITSLSYDHENILGKNIYKIIDEKLGVLRKDTKLFLAKNKPFIENYIKSKVEVMNATSSYVIKNNYQSPYNENYATAKLVTEYILGKSVEDNYSLKLPQARLETIGNVTFDGSHNPSGIMALMKNINEFEYIIFTTTSDRNILKIYNLLKISGKKIILTTIPGNPRSISQIDAAKLDCKFIANPIDALNFVKYKENKVIVCGSFYLCGYIMTHLGVS